MTTAISLTLMALCLLLSAYFSATETAFSSLSTARMRTLAEQGDRRAELALRLHSQYDPFQKRTNWQRHTDFQAVVRPLAGVT